MDKFFNWSFVLLVWGFTAYLTRMLYKQKKQLIRLRNKGLRSMGTITGHRFTGSDDGAYMLLVAFLTQHGYRQVTESKMSHSLEDFPTGARVAVLYDATNPADCFVDTHVERGAGYFMAALVLLVAIGSLVFLVFGLPLQKAAT